MKIFNRVRRLFLQGFGEFSAGFMAAWPSLPRDIHTEITALYILTYTVSIPPVPGYWSSVWKNPIIRPPGSVRWAEHRGFLHAHYLHMQVMGTVLKASAKMILFCFVFKAPPYSLITKYIAADIFLNYCFEKQNKTKGKFQKKRRFWDVFKWWKNTYLKNLIVFKFFNLKSSF